jgi:hypothetical protein
MFLRMDYSLFVSAISSILLAIIGSQVWRAQPSQARQSLRAEQICPARRRFCVPGRRRCRPPAGHEPRTCWANADCAAGGRGKQSSNAPAGDETHVSRRKRSRRYTGKPGR